MKIKTATIDDAEEINRIHDSAVRTTCKNYYTEEQIEAWLEGRSPQDYHDKIKKGDMYVAEDKGKIVGYGHAVPGEIFAVFVDPIFHKKGIGKMLLEYGLKIALKDHQKVKVESTINAEGFYKKHGFVKVKDDIHTTKGIEAPIIVMEYSARLPNTSSSQKLK